MEALKYKKRILVTGGAGFIGSNYLNYAVKRWPRELFINVDMLTYASDPKNILVDASPNYVFEKVDICDEEELGNVFEKYQPTHVVHFAAESHVDESIKTPNVFARTNVVGTSNLAQLARVHGVQRFLFISTDEVYGELATDDAPFTEESPYGPRNPYSASKAAAELMMLSYARTFGLPVVITRSSNAYGPNQDRTKLIPKFITNLLEGNKVPLYAKGENIRTWLYVADAVRGIDLAFRKGTDGEIYNLGGTEELTNMEVTKTLLSALGKTAKEIEHVPDRPGHDFRYALSSDKAKEALGWEPTTRFEEGIKKTIAFYKKKNGHA